MKCTYCGSEASANEKFCRCCGTRLEAETAVQPPETPPEETPVPAPAPTPAPAPAPAPVRSRPNIQLPTRRSLTKMFFLGILTAGIYPLVIMSRIASELNIAASRCDGRRTMPYFASLPLIPLTLGIYGLVWMHGLCSRIGCELTRRGIRYDFGASDFWLWNMLGSLILIGPFVFTHKLMKAMNLVNGDFNFAG